MNTLDYVVLFASIAAIARKAPETAAIAKRAQPATLVFFASIFLSRKIDRILADNYLCQRTLQSIAKLLTKKRAQTEWFDNEPGRRMYPAMLASIV